MSGTTSTGYPWRTWADESGLWSWAIEIRPGVTCASSMGGVFADPSAALAALDDYLADDPEALGLGSR